MLRRTLNLGILAHVDAGKTTLTERLLYEAGVIDAPGSVDAGTTQTDSLELEQRRGITIKSAVVSFEIDGVTVNLIDTPGHPDFIAEVERVLAVLDGAVLVVSAVEGVQAQTPLLIRALQRLRVPTLLFVNKIDRSGADPERVLRLIAERLTPAVVAMGAAHEIGTRAARVSGFDLGDEALAGRLVGALAEHDEAILEAYVDDDGGVPYERLRTELAAQTARGLVHPVFFGSASTGAGVELLRRGIVELLPARERDAGGPLSASVFKVDRGASGEKIAFVRMFSGTLSTRDRVRLEGGEEQKVTAISVFDRGAAARAASVEAGRIAQVWGLRDVRIGDVIGVRGGGAATHHFPPPTLETVVVPRRSEEKAALHAALSQLAEQDPLIDLRQDDSRQEFFVSLYGEVQKEVLEATLASDFGVEVEFGETTTICIERPVGVGEGLDTVGAEGNPFLATLGFRVEPGAPGAGATFRLGDLDVRTVPMNVYKSLGEFRGTLEELVRETLSEGLLGWEVRDWTVTLTESGYVSPGSTSRDFRLLLPLVLMSALQKAGTVVCEPIHRFRLELAAELLGNVYPALGRLGARADAPDVGPAWAVVEGDISAARMHELQQQLRGLTRGEGVLELAFDRYEPVDGDPPARPRTDLNPLDRDDYLLRLARPGVR